MELWSLMHFLMPHVFESHRDFKEWFSNPMAGMVEGNSEYNDSLIKRLHKVLRPFILRRLKAEVEKQMPKKYFHLVKCPLSKRQRFLYDDFMSRAKTKETLNSENLLSVINILMQLRKCCNHPNLFEPRPTLSPLVVPAASAPLTPQAGGLLAYRPLLEVDLASTPLLLAPLETSISAYTWFRCSSLRCPPTTMLVPPPDNPTTLTVPPRHKLRLSLRSPAPPPPSTLALQTRIEHKFCQVEQHPVCGPVVPLRLLARPDLWLWRQDVRVKTQDGYFQPLEQEEQEQEPRQQEPDLWHPPKVLPQVLKRKAEEQEDPYQDQLRHARGVFSTSLFRGREGSPGKSLGTKRRRLENRAREQELLLPELEDRRQQEVGSRRQRNLLLNDRRTCLIPMYGQELVELAEGLCRRPKQEMRDWLAGLSPCLGAGGEQEVGEEGTCWRREERSCYTTSLLLPSLERRVEAMTPMLRQVLLLSPTSVPASYLCSYYIYYSLCSYYLLQPLLLLTTLPPVPDVHPSLQRGLPPLSGQVLPGRPGGQVPWGLPAVQVTGSVGTGWRSARSGQDTQDCKSAALRVLQWLLLQWLPCRQ